MGVVVEGLVLLGSGFFGGGTGIGNGDSLGVGSGVAGGGVLGIGTGVGVAGGLGVGVAVGSVRGVEVGDGDVAGDGTVMGT